VTRHAAQVLARAQIENAKTTPCTVGQICKINGLSKTRDPMRILRIPFDPSGKTLA
jgi:hypothetical protein